MQDRRYEQGGVVSFVIVAVALAALLVGGLWWAKMQRSQTTAVNQPTSQVAKTQDEKPNPAVSAEDEAESSDGSSEKASNSSQNTNSETTATTSAPASEQSSETSSTSNASTTPSVATETESSPSVASTGPAASVIPSTGPTDVLAVLAALGAVSFGIYAYVQSSKRVRASALK